jgi:hypothetical protein
MKPSQRKTLPRPSALKTPPSPSTLNPQPSTILLAVTGMSPAGLAPLQTKHRAPNPIL